MSKYLQRGMSLVYLDQCAVSRLVGGERNALWKPLRDAVLAAHASRRILCPLSLEHLSETAAMKETDAIEADTILRRLSFGWSLAPEPRLIARQIFCQITGTRLSRAQFLQHGLWYPLGTPGLVEQFRKLKAELDAFNEWTMQGINELNALVRSGKRGGKILRQFLSERRAQTYTTGLHVAVVEAIQRGGVEIKAHPHNPQCADWATSVVFALVNENRFRLPQLAALAALLEKTGIASIPTLRIKSQLEGHQFFIRENITAGDQYDITRIACALPFADVLVTDGGKAAAIRELGLDKEYGTEVFSMKPSELPSLVERISR